MKILFLLLMIVASCSKGTEGGRDIVLKKNNLLSQGIYYLSIDDVSNPYKSTILVIIETSEYGLTFYQGSLNEYSKDHQGNPRAGNHPDPDFLLNYASYEVQKNNNAINLNFIASSCNDYSFNPFSSILPRQTDSFYQVNDKLVFKMDGQMNTLAKMAESDFDHLMTIKKLVYCHGEPEND